MIHYFKLYTCGFAHYAQMFKYVHLYFLTAYKSCKIVTDGAKQSSFLDTYINALCYFTPMSYLDLYEKLRMLEIHLDRAVLKKRLLIEESHYKRIKCTKRLRVFLDFKLFDGAFLLKIDGRVVNDFTNTTELRASDVLKSLAVRLQFSDKQENASKRAKNSFSTAITTDGNNEFYEWKKHRDDMIDCFELNLDRVPDSITVLLEFENTFDRYKLPHSVSELFGKETETKTGLLIDFWKYIRINRLNIEPHSFLVTCDDALKKIFGVPHIKLLDLENLVTPFLLPLDPLIFHISTDNNYTNNFDVPIEVDDFYEFPIMYPNSAIFQLEQKIADLFDILKRYNGRYEVINRFSKDPVSFINEWIIKQAHLLKESKFDANNKTFYDPLVQETIFNMLQDYK